MTPDAEGRAWVRLDNAANIFLAARSEVDTKVFRLSAELDEPIDQAALQQALDRVYAQYPLFRAVLRKGVFWYYLQQSDLHPEVVPDDGPSVAHIYHHDSRDLLFRVLHRGRRISLEIFHALTDGTGAVWFFQDLLTEYVRLRHPAEFEAAPDADRSVKQEFAVDAFTDWFRSRTGTVPFSDDASAAVTSPTTELPPGARAAERSGRQTVDRPRGDGLQAVRRPRRDVVRVRGTHTPDNRSRLVELSMPVAPVLALARAEGVSLTIHLLAVFFDSIRKTQIPSGRRQSVTASVPVNLRHYFPTQSGRNFFATTMLTHTYGIDDDADSVGAVSRTLGDQFGRVLTREGLERKIRRLVNFERNPALRVVPRPLKDLVLGAINRLQNRGITLAITNLGRITLPEPVDPHVGRVFLHVSAVRPQFSMVSHGDVLSVSFTSPFIETDYLAQFVRHLTGSGVPVTVDVTRVTAEEIAAGEPSEAGGAE